VITVGLAGDTMLGRRVAQRLEAVGTGSLVAPEVVAAAREADVFVLNLECCISDRGEPWRAPGKPFFFRAPTAAVDVLASLGVDCVTLANNHALDYGPRALLDTFVHLERAGIRWVGAGPDVARARATIALEARGYRLLVVGVTDHPADFAVERGAPGVAFADLRRGMPPWLLRSVEAAVRDVTTGPGAGGVLVTPHWGPNMVDTPVRHVCRAAAVLRDAGVTIVAGHSAHVFQGVDGTVMYDLGDFLDDYAVDQRLRNDLGLLFLVDLDEAGARRIHAIPLALDFCTTRLARDDEVDWITRRFRRACAEFGTDVRVDGDRLVVDCR
jgi:poly-gamma-glutamate capsule biosynthesis protein CapA/YwtB (metallophosphatase superfamily)